MQEGTCSAKLLKRVGTKEEFYQNAAALYGNVLAIILDPFAMTGES